MEGNTDKSGSVVCRYAGECQYKASRTDWRVYGPLSMEHLGSELGVIRRKISFDCCLCS